MKVEWGKVVRGQEKIYDDVPENEITDHAWMQCLDKETNGTEFQGGQLYPSCPAAYGRDSSEVGKYADQTAKSDVYDKGEARV